jgi:trk system potassium uptake protein TrkH
MMMSNLSDNFSFRNTEGLLKTIVGYTVNIEAVGAILLIIGFMLEGRFTFWECFYYGIFHSIAGYCNAGFSPFDNSLQDFGPMIKLVVAFLIVAGGIGIYVIYDLIHTRRKVALLKIHTRLVVISSLLLIVAGTLLIKLFEHLEGNDPIAWIDAFFMSVSSRTAGYCTVPLNELSPNTLSMIIIFMMIGAAPGSTGGGMKVTVVGVAVLAIINTFLGNRRVLLFRREIAIDNILKSFTIIVTFVLLVAVGAAVLSPMLESSEQSVWFEAASALSTTGMSMDVTGTLPGMAKMLIMLFMFIGRIGPFTIFLFLLDREKVSRISYPEERIIIG